MIKNKNKKLLSSFTVAWKGITHVTKTEVNFKIHLAAANIAISLGFYYHINREEWLVLCVFIGLVLMAELFNTAIENIIDLVSPEYEPKAGLIKDISAGAVLLISMAALISGLLIFIPKINF